MRIPLGPSGGRSASADNHQIWSIQYLRALAAIAVILAHQMQDVAGLFSFGLYGVDLFFVISGYIMVAMTDRREITPKRFFLDRIGRIAPLYWLTTLCAFALAFTDFNQSTSHGDVGHLVKSLFFVPSYDQDGNLWPTLFLGWTLNFEMFFYAVFAAALFLKKSHRLPFMAALFGILICSGLVVDFENPLLATYTSPMLAEFMIGACLATAVIVDGDGKHRLAALALLALAMGAVVLLGLIYPRVLYGAGAGGLVALGLFVERKGWLPRIPFLRMLGDASYSIYLCQQFAFDAAPLASATLGAVTGLGMASGGLMKVLAIGGAIALGLAVYWLIERPSTWIARRIVSHAAGAPVRLQAATVD